MILGIETSTPVSSVAIGDESGKIVHTIVEGGAHHAEHLIPAVRTMCHSEGVTLTDLSAIAVDIGPGLFTGLRVGVSTAKSLAMALGIGIVGIVSLDALVDPLCSQPGRVVAAIDARRGEVFAAAYVVGPGEPSGLTAGETVAPGVLTPEELAALVAGQVAAARAERPSTGGPPVRLVGDGLRRYVPGGADGAVFSGDDHPSASALVAMAARCSPAVLRDPAGVVPVYLRGADVRIHFTTRTVATEVESPAPEGQS